MIVGLDEVGRGAWAGPVVAGAVCFDTPYKIKDRRLPVFIDDSKRLSEQQRIESAQWIYENALFWGIGKGTVSTINRRGIVPAANYAFRRAFKPIRTSVPNPITSVLLDAFYIPRLGVHKKYQTPVIKGDQKEFAIAAASIIAKVWRDDYMARLGNKSYKPYLWEQNKGYGTKAHQMAIRTHGITKHHRTLYLRKLLNEER